MDITVTSITSSGKPGTFLSIRAGETRRQAPLKVNEVCKNDSIWTSTAYLQPFHFPTTNLSSFKADIFTQLGSQYVSLQDFRLSGEQETVLDYDGVKFAVKVTATDPNAPAM